MPVRQVPIPQHMDLYHLQEEAEPSDRTALESVVDYIKREIEVRGGWIASHSIPQHSLLCSRPEKVTSTISVQSTRRECLGKNRWAPHQPQSHCDVNCAHLAKHNEQHACAPCLTPAAPRRG